MVYQPVTGFKVCYFFNIERLLSCEYNKIAKNFNAQRYKSSYSELAEV